MQIDQQPRPKGFAALPRELRLQIFEYVLMGDTDCNVFTNSESTGGLLLNERYKASQHLRPLLVCKQFYLDGRTLAFNCTDFVVSNLFLNIPSRLQAAFQNQQQQQQQQLQALRHITFVADARHFRQLIDWKHGSPFGIIGLRLETLTIVLHRSSFWHYLFDFTAGIVSLLRQLQGVEKLIFVKNDARVKGSFRTWYNRLVGLIMKVDHQERYLKPEPVLEEVWWGWGFDEVAGRVCLDARPKRAVVEEEEVYLRDMMPLLEELRESVEREEVNLDPRARNGA